MVEEAGYRGEKPQKTALLLRNEKQAGENPSQDSVSVVSREQVVLNEDITDVKYVHGIISWQQYKKEMVKLRRPAIKRYFENKFNPKIVAAEIGVFQGLNARSMLCYCSDMKLYLIDGYEKVTLETHTPLLPQEDIDRIKLEATLNLLPFKERTVWIQKQSKDAVKDLPDEFFDFVYIDGDHEYEFVKKDIEMWYPKVKKDGMIAGHDIEMIEVYRAFEEFVDERKIPRGRWGTETGHGNSDWWIFREEFPLFKDFMRSAIAYISKFEPKKGAEVGIYEGRHAKNILFKLPSLKTLFCVDNNTDGALHTAKYELFPFNDKVVIIEKPSVEAATIFQDESLDFVYIDADHTYEAVTEDLEAWHPKVKKGGVLGGHDYNLCKETTRLYPAPSCWDNVKKAVDDFIVRHNYRMLNIGNCLDGTQIDWWIVKQ